MTSCLFIVICWILDEANSTVKFMKANTVILVNSCLTKFKKCPV